DHVGGVTNKHRPRLTQPVWAEKRLQDFAVSSVLRRVEPQRDHRNWASRWLKRQSSGKYVGTPQRCQHVLTAGEVVEAIHEYHRSGVAQNLPPGASISGHRQGEVVKPRKVKARAVQAFIGGAHADDLSSSVRSFSLARWRAGDGRYRMRPSAARSRRPRASGCRIERRCSTCLLDSAL